MNNTKIFILDSTLRDGAQGQNISFSLEDKIKICRALDSIGIDYIEAGNPSSNPKDIEFFRAINELSFKSKIVAFGSTRKPNIDVKDDKGLESLINSTSNTVTIFGKSSEFQVKEILKTSLEENLNMIDESIKYLVYNGLEVIFDAEHFFDGFKENEDYAIKTLLIAENAGAKSLVLCDTNGGTLPNEITEIVGKVKKLVKIQLGIHCHNDIGMAVANSTNAILAGVTHLQGTFLGIGERCGNTNLSSIIPTLQLKLGYKVIKDSEMKNITSIARYLGEVSNITLSDELPYVGNSAFAHKGGMHIDAVVKNSKSYEHIDPESIGNSRKLLVSEVSGRSTILNQVQKIFPNINRNSKEILLITDKLKQLEHTGYQFEGAEASIELIIRKIIGKYRPFFKLNSFKTIVEEESTKNNFTSTALINIEVENRNEITAAEGEGPINALDKALRKALEVFYPQLKYVRLVDYKVRVLDTDRGTDSKVRVLIESTDGVESWSTIGVSRDIIEASWIALVDSIEYKLIKDIEKNVKTYF